MKPLFVLAAVAACLLTISGYTAAHYAGLYHRDHGKLERQCPSFTKGG